MKRALVTGASGFVGANLAARLLADGYETHLLLRPGHKSWRLKDLGAAANVHAVDLRDRESVERAVQAIRPEWVFHLAAYGAYPFESGFDRMTATNVTGSAALIDACASVGVEAFVQTGSSSEYGYKDHPAQESELIEPNSHYAITKAAATHYCRLAAQRHDFHAVTLRLYSVYGPYEEPTRLVPALIVNGVQGRLPPLTAPGTARDFVHVDDVTSALLKVAASTRLPRGAIYNVCTGRQSDLASLVSIARRLMNVAEEPVWASMPGRSWDTDVWVGSPEALARDAGWRAGISLESGLAATIQWFREQPGRIEEYERYRTRQNPTSFSSEAAPPVPS